MMSQEQVSRLPLQVDGGKVLSVYLDTTAGDPAGRRGWRTRLNRMARTLQEVVGAESESDRRLLERALSEIESEVQLYAGRLPGRGWVAFATPDRVLHAEASPAPMPDLIRWEAEAHIAPFVRALKQSRPVVIVLAHQREVHLLRYRYGGIEHREVLRPHASREDLDGSSKRAATHSGVRGQAREEAAQRARKVATQRLIHDIASKLGELRDQQVLFALAGNTEMIAALPRDLPPRLRARVIEISDLSADDSEAAILAAVEPAASELSARLQRALMEEIIDTAHSGGRACLGPEHTDRALQAGAVDTLVVSRTLASSEPGLANRLIWAALNQGASIDEVPEGAADPLDAVGGVGARLRFPV